MSAARHPPAGLLAAVGLPLRAAAAEGPSGAAGGSEEGRGGGRGEECRLQAAGCWLAAMCVLSLYLIALPFLSLSVLCCPVLSLSVLCVLCGAVLPSR